MKRFSKEFYIVLLIAIQFTALIVFALSFVSCADTGSRHAVDQEYIRGLGITFPIDARPHEREWMRETLEEHIKIVEKHSGRTYLPYIRVEFVRTQADLHRKYIDFVNRFPTNKPQPIFGCTAMGFYHADSLFTVGGPKWEGPDLAHHLWHIVEDPDILHLDGRWQKLLWDDIAMSMWLAGKR